VTTTSAGVDRVPGSARVRRPAAWPWALLWAAVAAATALLVRLPGPAMLDPDEYASALDFRYLISGRRLGELLLSTPKPLLTVVYGLAWNLTHDWRACTLLAVAAFALAVTALSRALARLAGAAGAVAVAPALLGSGALLLQVSRANSVIWALAGWAVTLDALARPRPRWGLAAAALLLAALARAEGWLLLVPAAVLGVIAWRRGERRALWLLLPLAAPALWFGHDLLLAADPLYSMKVPEHYTNLVSGRGAISPPRWLELVGRRYWSTPALAGLALLGVAWLVRRHAWLWLCGLGVVTAGTLALFGVEAWRGTYISFRYYDPADAGVRVLAAIGAAVLATAAAALLGRVAARRRMPPASAVAAVLACVAVAAACWPLAPVRQGVLRPMDAASRFSRNTTTALAVLRPVAQRPGTVVVVPTAQRARMAVELGLPLERVRDLFVATLTEPLERALTGSAAVYHDSGGDQPRPRFTPLERTAPGRMGSLALTPLRTDPSSGLYVLQVRPAAEDLAATPSD
jgi:hypothetical protein